MTLIIDCHGHYTTAPAPHNDWREAQKAAAEAAAKAEAEAAKKAEKAALLAQVAALKKAARGEKPSVRQNPGERIVIHVTYCRTAMAPLENYDAVLPKDMFEEKPLLANLIGRNQLAGMVAYQRTRGICISFVGSGSSEETFVPSPDPGGHPPGG